MARLLQEQISLKSFLDKADCGQDLYERDSEFDLIMQKLENNEFVSKIELDKITDNLLG